MHDVFKWLLIDQLFKINKLVLLKKVIDGRAPEYLTASLDTLRFEHIYPTRAKTSYRLPKPRTEAMRGTFFYSTIKDVNALNLNPTASFNSMKATLIKSTAPVYTVDNFKVKKLFLFLIFSVYIFVHRFSFLLIYRLFVFNFYSIFLFLEGH